MRAIRHLAVLGLSCFLSSASAQDPTPASPVVADILKLSRAKVDEGVIVTYVQKAPPGNVSAADLLTLHSNGLSSRVLLALLDSHSPSASAPADAQPPVPDQLPAQPAAQTVEVASPVVEVPYVNYVSAPVYVGPGSLYYYDDGWWGFGLGLGIGWGWGYAGWGWNSCYPWYGYGWYPYFGYYYANCGSGNHHGDDHHHGDDGHHGHGGHDGDGDGGHKGYAVQTPQGSGGRSGPVGRSTVAASAGNANRGGAAARAGTPVSGATTARAPMTASRAGGTVPANSSGRNAINNLPGTRGVESRGGNTTSRSSTYVANGRATTTGVAQNTGARSGVAPSGGTGRPVASPGGVQVATTVARSQAAPARSVPSTYRSVGTAAPGYTGNSGNYSGYQTGPRAPANSAGAGGSYSPGTSYSAPSSSMGNYSVGRSSGGSTMGAPSGGGGSRGFSGGGGGFSGGGSRGSSGGGGGGGGRR